jgi:hypothetical protein
LYLFQPGFVVEGQAPASSGVQIASGYADKCTAATLRGTYGIFEQGTIVGQLDGVPIPTPYPAVTSVVITYDGDGNFSGSFVGSLGGGPASGDFSGTYSVKRDCTFTAGFTVPTLGVDFHLAGIIIGQGIFQEIHYVYTDAFMVASGTGKKIPPGGCSLGTLKGTYGNFGGGAIWANPPLWISYSGNFTADGAGRFSGETTSNFNGLSEQVKLTGTYEVTPNCVISATVTSPAEVVHETGVMTGYGDFQELHSIVTDPGSVVSDTVKKQ